MKPFTVTEQTTVFSGRVKMDHAQAFPRSGHLIPVPGLPDTYDIRDFIVLATGETVLIDPLPKTDRPAEGRPKAKAAKKAPRRAVKPKAKKAAKK